MNEKLGEEVIKQVSNCVDIKGVINVAEELGYEGYASDEVLNSLSRALMGRNLSERKKGMMMEILSRAEESLVLGATELPMV